VGRPQQKTVGRGAGRRHTEQGSIGMEVVILVPVLMGVVLLISAFGRAVDTNTDVDAAAREAARAASYERDAASAIAAGQGVATATLPSNAACAPASVDTSDFVPGGSVEVTITCEVSYEGLGLIGLPGATTMTGESAAPLDEFRRTG